MKLCVFCKHIYLDMGCPAYSEYTPAEKASIECTKDHWHMRNSEGIETYREYIIKAEQCPNYEQVKS